MSHCGFEQQEDAIECIKCGIVFAKYSPERHHPIHGTPVPPPPASSKDDDHTTGQVPLSKSCSSLLNQRQMILQIQSNRVSIEAFSAGYSTIYKRHKDGKMLRELEKKEYEP